MELSQTCFFFLTLHVFESVGIELSSRKGGTDYPFGSVLVHSGYSSQHEFTTQNLVDFVILPTGYIVTIEQNPNPEDGNKAVLYKHKENRLKLVHKADVGLNSCIRYRTINGRHYVLVSESNYQAEAVIFHLNQEILTLDEVLRFPSQSISDFAVWPDSHSMDFYLIVSVASEFHKNRISYRTRSPIYRWSAKYDKYNPVTYVETLNALGVESFRIGNSTYIALANYQNALGNIQVNSYIYCFDFIMEKLKLQQKLKTSGAIGFTYFSFTSELYSESFLIVANSPQDKSINAPSKIYKWYNGSFTYFQTIDVMFPEKFIVIHNAEGEFLTVTWSKINGLEAFQYDGWRFVKSRVGYKTSGESFVSLKLFTIGNHNVLALSEQGEEGRIITLFEPVFRVDTTISDIYLDIIDWSNYMNKTLETLLQSNLTTLPYQKISRVEFVLNNTFVMDESAALDLIIQTISSTLTNVVSDEWNKKIQPASDSKFNFLNMKGKIEIIFGTGRTLSSVKDVKLKIPAEMKKPNDKEYIGESRSAVNERKPENHNKIDLPAALSTLILEDYELNDENSVLNYHSQHYSPIQMKSVRVIKTVHNVRTVVPLWNKNEDILIILIVKSDGFLTYFPWDRKMNIFEMNEDKNRLEFNANIELTNLAPVQLNEGVGFYIEGVENNEVIGQIYKVNSSGMVEISYKLPVENQSEVKGVIINSELKQCFIIVPKRGLFCNFYCPNHISGHFSCSNVSQVYVNMVEEGADIMVLNDNHLVIWQYDDHVRDMLVARQAIHAKVGSQITASSNGINSYIVILSREDITIFRREERSYKLWQQHWRNGDVMSIAAISTQDQALIIYKLKYSRDSNWNGSLSQRSTALQMYLFNNLHLGILNSQSDFSIFTVSFTS